MSNTEFEKENVLRIEESFHPDDLESYRYLRECINVNITEVKKLTDKAMSKLTVVPYAFKTNIPLAATL